MNTIAEYLALGYRACDLQQWTLAVLKSFVDSGVYPNQTAMYRAVSKESGISESTIRQFYQGSQPNLSIETLDKIINAIASF